MPRLTTFTAPELIDMILMYGEALQNGNRALALYRERFPNRVVPRNARVIVNAIQRVREGLPVTGRVEGAAIQDELPVPLQDQILRHFALNPESSTRNAGRQFNTSHTAVHRILKRDQQHPYKFLKVHALLPRDLLPRNEFSNWLLRQHHEDGDFISKIIWTDESTFTRNGVWNQRNCHYWSRLNLHHMKETGHQYRWAVNVWAAIHGDQIIGPVFIDGNLNADKFIQLINGPLAEYVNTLPEEQRRQTWLQLDGAPAHAAVRVRNALNDMFEDRWIGRFGPKRWPARSPDLTPLDFFLWGAVKNEVYSQPRITQEELRNKINEVFQKLRDTVNLRHVMESVKRRCETCAEIRGRHVENRYLRRNRQN